jgi:beta-glucosidase
MGGESRTKGVNVLLGPVVGPLGRMAEGGRNWEGEFVGNICGCRRRLSKPGFSNDPYLCGALAGLTVSGMQSNGVITSTKVGTISIDVLI